MSGMTFKAFRHWLGHPLITFAITVLLAPLFALCGVLYLLPMVGLTFGFCHEMSQYLWGHEEVFNWRDLMDFTIGGVVASGAIWLVKAL